MLSSKKIKIGGDPMLRKAGLYQRCRNRSGMSDFSLCGIGFRYFSPLKSRSHSNIFNSNKVLSCAFQINHKVFEGLGKP